MDDKKIATFQERFNEILESSPKSRSTIAKELRVAKQTISAWSTGQSSPRLPVVSVLSKYFNVSICWLLGYDVDRNSESKEYLRYSEAIDDIVNTNQLTPLSDEEQEIIAGHRSLSFRGQQLHLDYLNYLKLQYGKKSEDNSAQSV